MKVELARLPYLAGRARCKLSDHFRSIAQVHNSDKHVLQQFADTLRLRLGRHRVGMGEYIDQGMYSKQIFPDPDLSSLGGWWFKEYVHARLNNIRWEGMVTDKLVMYALFEQFGLPHPKVHAAAWQRARACGSVPVFRDAEGLAGFLRGAGGLYPLFCKPVKGSYGRGAARIEAYEAGNDALVFNDGSRMPVLAFLRSLEDDGWGILVQEAVLAAAETRPICGEAVSGCRVIMLLDNDGPRPYKVVWKVPGVNNAFDNYQNGKSGNMIAAVDVGSGRVIRSVSGKGVDLRVDRPHSDTGYQLVGSELPQWREMMAVLQKAAASFPGFRWQHWDVGITAGGPILYELNSAGNTDIAQMAYGKGIHDAELEAFLRRYGGREPPPGKVFAPPP